MTNKLRNKLLLCLVLVLYIIPSVSATPTLLSIEKDPDPIATDQFTRSAVLLLGQDREIIQVTSELTSPSFQVTDKGNSNNIWHKKVSDQAISFTIAKNQIVEISVFGTLNGNTRRLVTVYPGNIVVEPTVEVKQVIPDPVVAIPVQEPSNDKIKAKTNLITELTKLEIRYDKVKELIPEKTQWAIENNFADAQRSLERDDLEKAEENIAILEPQIDYAENIIDRPDYASIGLVIAIIVVGAYLLLPKKVDTGKNETKWESGWQ